MMTNPWLRGTCVMPVRTHGVQGAGEGRGHLSSGGKSLLICPLIGGEREQARPVQRGTACWPHSLCFGAFSQGHARLAVTPGPWKHAGNLGVGSVNLAEAFPVQCV